MENHLPLIHMIAVITFLLIYLVKTPLLLMNKMESLDKVRRITKMPEMIVSFLFLATGVWMLVKLPTVNTLMIIKLVMVFASIPIAIIGFKKKNKAMALIALLLVIGSYGLAEVSKKKRIKGDDIVVDTNKGDADLGKTVYEAKCANCHGPQGNAGVAGAKDLTITTMSKDEIKTITRNGKGAMPGVELTDEQLDAVTDYVQSLKK